MHGVRREKTSEEVQKEKRREELKAIEKFKNIQQICLDKYHEKDYTKEAMETISQALSMNAEFYTLWNYRRKILSSFQEKLSEEEMSPIYENELRFMESLIPKFPKSYWIWLHREWVTTKMAKCDWQRELKLCGKMLSLDERNFHCWNYRRFVAKHSNTTLNEEFDFTTKKIEDNFSNYSAWHNRSAILTSLYGSGDLSKLIEIYNQEFDLIQNAIYTEPTDQSIWFYHRWLIDQVCKSATSNELDEILKRELKMCNEIREILEGEEVKPKDHVQPKKWPIMQSNFIMAKMFDKNESILLSNLKLLLQIDPIRKNYYTDYGRSILNQISDEKKSSLSNELVEVFS